MRVLLTTDTIGGVWTFTKELTTELLHQGHAVGLLSFGRAPSPSQTTWCTSQEWQYGERFRYVASDVPLEWMEANDVAYSGALPTLLLFIKTFAPDVIHSGQFCFGSLPIDVPIVVTAHSDVLSWATACLPESLPSSPWLERYTVLVARGLANASAVVAPTRWMLDALTENFPLSAPSCVISNGRSLPLAVPHKPRKVQAVSVGRLWDKAKNLSLLRQTESSMPILIAGEQRCEGSIAIPVGRLQCLGLLDEAKLLNLFASSSVYVAASLYEPFGLAPLEAALCGCVVVAHDIPSLREVWGDAALYFEDAIQLGHVLDQLNVKSNHLELARRRSLRRARKLTATRMTSGYLALYTSLLGSRALLPSPGLATHAC